MTFGESIRICFSKYADFSGIAGRSEFWWWALFNLIGSLALNAIDYRLSWAWTIATLLPYLAVTTRRLHDTGRNGWLQLLFLVPVIGWILMIIWLAQKGRAGLAVGMGDRSDRVERTF